MKKNLIYTMTFLLCGTLLFSSCEDMLNVESNRVEYEFDDWTFNDSVYSVLGIVKAVQEIGDRHVLLNELRADLVSINETKAVVDIQELSRSEFNLATNKYLDVKDYYSIINNCNIYLARVDTNLTKDNVKLMLPEFVAVKSVRAWTYMQLAINHNEIPYFTEPILTHADAERVMSTPKLTRNEVFEKLIADILPYENPATYTMPAWDNDGKILKFGFGDKDVEYETKKLFVPIRMLLGDMYLWKGDYRNAAQCYYDLITGARTNNTVTKYVDNSSSSVHVDKNGEFFNTGFARLFDISNFSNNSPKILTLIPYAKDAMKGTISELSNIFLPVQNIGGSQVVASPSIISLSERQVYLYVKGELEETETLKDAEEYEYSTAFTFKTKGDLRLLSTTCFQIASDEQKTEYKNLITKFNLENNIANAPYSPTVPTSYIMVSRPEHAYLCFAEALMGLERQGYQGAMNLAMEVLKVGVKKSYEIVKDPVYADSVRLNIHGKPIYTIDEATGDTIYKVDKYLDREKCGDLLVFNFENETFKANTGIHSRGSGFSRLNEYYALDDINVARYLGKTKKSDDGVESLDPTKPLEHEDSVLYVSELILDEMALEFAWEGSRFGDLIRVASALGDPNVLAMRVAGRAYHNTVSHRHPDFEFDPVIREKMSNEANWYLPLPQDEVVEPGEVVETPDDFNPSEDSEPSGDQEPSEGGSSEETDSPEDTNN
ncbi:MAG: RagB/SusD family nutrient uptake outer membrane protein [Bacteroidaceae bacterium]|nr:RagB/SusD family nutrient uptake outer membrane protein [Bacteroidaceae bacterium]